MGRWSHLDTDEERLPEGMTRIGYDADTQVYTYRDADGSHWEGAPGCEFGKLFPVRNDAPPLPVAIIDSDIEGEEQPYVLHDYDGDFESELNNKDGAAAGITSPKKARVAKAKDMIKGGSKKLPPLSMGGSEEEDSDIDSVEKLKLQKEAPEGQERRHKRRAQRQTKGQQKDTGLGRSGTLSRLTRYLAGGDKDRDTHSPAPPTRAATVGHSQNKRTGRKRATTFDEILGKGAPRGD